MLFEVFPQKLILHRTEFVGNISYLLSHCLALSFTSLCYPALGMKEPWLALEPLSLSPSLSLPLSPSLSLLSLSLSSPPLLSPSLLPPLSPLLSPSLSPSLLLPPSVCMGYHTYLWWQAEDLLAAGLLWCSLFCLIWSCLKLRLPWPNRLLPWPNRLLFHLVLGRGNGGGRKLSQIVREKQVGWGRGRGRELFVLSC